MSEQVAERSVQPRKSEQAFVNWPKHPGNKIACNACNAHFVAEMILREEPLHPSEDEMPRVPSIFPDRLERSLVERVVIIATVVWISIR